MSTSDGQDYRIIGPGAVGRLTRRMPLPPGNCGRFLALMGLSVMGFLGCWHRVASQQPVAKTPESARGRA